jgi:hypothetical protein
LAIATIILKDSQLYYTSKIANNWRLLLDNAMTVGGLLLKLAIALIVSSGGYSVF